MSKRIGMIAAVAAVILACAGIVVAFSAGKEESVPEYPSYDEVKTMSEAIDVSAYDPNYIIPANSASGNLAENVEGDLSKAKVVIFEYADYQCEYCALFNPTVNEVLADYGEDVAIVFRTYLLSYHKNGVQAALAAEAAAKQGYWQEYKDLLFSEQDDWFYSTRNKFQKQAEDFFLRVAGSDADLAKFREDMRAEDSLQKIAFSMAIGASIQLEGTPSFFINGEKVNVNSLHDKVGELLGQ